MDEIAQSAHVRGDPVVGRSVELSNPRAAPPASSLAFQTSWPTGATGVRNGVEKCAWAPRTSAEM